MFCFSSEELEIDSNASNQRITMPEVFTCGDEDSVSSDDSSCASDKQAHESPRVPRCMCTSRTSNAE